MKKIASILKSPIFIFILGTCLIAILVIWGVKKYQQQVLLEKVFSEIPPYPEISNLLSFPGWETPKIEGSDNEAVYDKEKGVLLINNINANSFLVNNYNLSLKASKPLEIIFKMSSNGISQKERKQGGFLHLYNRLPLITEDNPPFLLKLIGVGFLGDSFLINYFDFSKSEKDFVQSLLSKGENIILPQETTIKIKIEDDESDNGEKITIYNMENGDLIKEIKLPLKIFQDKIYLGFDSRNLTRDPKGVQMRIERLYAIYNGRDVRNYIFFK